MGSAVHFSTGCHPDIQRNHPANRAAAARRPINVVSPPSYTRVKESFFASTIRTAPRAAVRRRSRLLLTGEAACPARPVGRPGEIIGNNDHNGEKHYDQLFEMFFEKNLSSPSFVAPSISCTA